MLNDPFRAPKEDLGTYEKPAHGWTCFHCGETFTTYGGARDHFGAGPEREPGCLIDRVATEEGGRPEPGRGLLMALRKAEDEVERLNAELFKYYEEDGPKDREMAALRAEHRAALQRAEDNGYAKALRDIEAGKVETDHAKAERDLAAWRASAKVACRNAQPRAHDCTGWDCGVCMPHYVAAILDEALENVRPCR